MSLPGGVVLAFALTDQMHFLAGVAFPQGVVLRKSLPVFSLVRAQQPRALAQGTGIFQGVEQGGADKLGAVGDSLEDFSVNASVVVVDAVKEAFI